MSINVAKWTFFLSLCASRITSFLLSYFFQISCWDRLELFPCIIHCSLCIRNFHHLWQRNKLVLQIVKCHRSESFACDVVIMIFRLKRFHSLPCGFMRFHNTLIKRFVSLVGCNLRLRRRNFGLLGSEYKYCVSLISLPLW